VVACCICMCSNFAAGCRKHCTEREGLDMHCVQTHLACRFTRRLQKYRYHEDFGKIQLSSTKRRSMPAWKRSAASPHLSRIVAVVHLPWSGCGSAVTFLLLASNALVKQLDSSHLVVTRVLSSLRQPQFVAVDLLTWGNPFKQYGNKQLYFKVPMRSHHA
jgi:hypothetical protein